MTNGYVWLLAFAACPLAGAPLLASPAFRGYSRGCRVVLSGAVGAVLISWIMTVWALAGWRWKPLALLGAALAVCCLLRIGLRLKRGMALDGSPCKVEEDEGEGARPWERLLSRLAVGVSALCVIVVCLGCAIGRLGSPDMIYFWGPKAEQFAAMRTIDTAFLRTSYLSHFHGDYPPLVVNLFAWATMATRRAGNFPWGAATLTFPMLLAAMSIALAGILRSSLPRHAALCGAAFVTAIVALMGCYGQIGGIADMPLAFFEILAVALLLGPAAGERPIQVLASLCLAGAAATKVEGLPFALAVVGLFVLLRREGWRERAARAFGLLLPSAVFLGTWFYFGAVRDVFLGYEGYGPLLGVRFELLPGVMSAILLALGSVAGGLPFILPLVCFLAWRVQLRTVLLPLGVAAALFGFYVFTYLHSAIDPSIWIRWSAVRIFTPVAGLLALALVAGGSSPRQDRSNGRQRGALPIPIADPSPASSHR